MPIDKKNAVNSILYLMPHGWPIAMFDQYEELSDHFFYSNLDFSWEFPSSGCDFGGWK